LCFIETADVEIGLRDDGTASVLLDVVTGGVDVCDDHMGKKSINPPDGALIPLVGVVMADSDGMVVVAEVDNVVVIDADANNPPVW
jgi:hypothetical protein